MKWFKTEQTKKMDGMKERLKELMTEHTFTEELLKILNTGIADDKDDLDIAVSFDKRSRIDGFCGYMPMPSGKDYYYYCGKKFYITSSSKVKGDEIKIL